ncbi:MAG TPA: DUF5335 family protein [Tepidisphaeraceae bacterium]|jgi:hypothetical protein
MSLAPSIDVPKETWKQFFNDFNKQHSGWAVTIEELAGELGDQREADDLPFQGISYDPVGSQAGDILVETGDTETAYDVHLVHRPTVVRVAMTEPAGEADIEIETEESYTTIVHVRRRCELPPPTTSAGKQ